MLRGLSLVLLLILAAGCSGESLSVVPVSGVIKDLNGNPIEGASVTFTPKTEEKIAPTSFGKTDAEGKYTLETVSGEAGALIGSHTVSISKNTGNEDDDAGTSLQSLIPPEFNTDSTLEFTVPKEGSTEANFEVKLIK